MSDQQPGTSPEVRGDVGPILEEVRESQTEGSVLSFHDICYTVTVKKKRERFEKEILKNVSGVFRPGMNAILGPTGSGKTSLLDILAARKDPRGLSGAVLIDGKEHPGNFKLISGYVIQDDIVMGTLSVRENLAFSAALRLPKTVSNEERRERVEDVISELGLTRVANSKVGTEVIRGVSGGERKRTNVGMELIIKPDIIFLDEPTTGLDAGTAESVIHTLAELSRRGRTIVFSIHQPRYSIFRLFDHMHLLARGNTVYHGPARGALTYFTSIGYECEAHNNPPDFFLDVINGDSTISRVVRDPDDGVLAVSAAGDDKRDYDEANARKEDDASRLSRAFQESNLFVAMKEETDRIFKGFSTTKEPRRQTVAYPTSFPKQLFIVSKRSLMNTLRNPLLAGIQYMAILFFSLLVCLIYYNLDDSITSGIQNRTGSAFFMTMHMIFGNFTAVEMFIRERGMYVHESASGFYRVSVYFLAKVFTDLVPLRVIPSTMYVVITYWVLGMQPYAVNFFIFYLTMLLITFASMSIFLAISSTVDISSVALLFTAMTFVFMMLFGGFLVNITTLPVWLQWIQYLSIFRYGMNAILINEMKDMQFCEELVNNITSCVNGTAFLTQQGIDYSAWGLWQNEMAMAIMGAGVLVIGYIQLRRIPKVK